MVMSTKILNHGFLLALYLTHLHVQYACMQICITCQVLESISQLTVGTHAAGEELIHLLTDCDVRPRWGYKFTAFKLYDED